MPQKWKTAIRHLPTKEWSFRSSMAIKCGLFISEHNNWLVATPDGIVKDISNTSHPRGL